METRIAKYTFIVWSLIISSHAVNFLPSIQWTPDNPILKNLKGQTRKVNIHDEIRIWCPKDYTQDTKTNYQVHESALHFALYKVKTKEEYDNCDARKGQRLLYCTDPSGKSTEDREHTLIVFDSTPISNIMDPYPPGHTYYFIGTSGGTEEDIDKKVGGKCQSHNMKLAIYVCKREENCSVDVLHGGWSLWKVNEETGLCERNCSNPAPQNGGESCSGPDKMECSKIISGRTTSQRAEKKSTTQTGTTTVEKTTKQTKTLTSTETTTQQKINTDKKLVQTLHYTIPTTLRSTPTTDSTMSDKNAHENERKPKGSNSDDVTLSMKGAILTFIGLFVLGCIVGIVQVLAILHVRSKRSNKQSEPQGPINHV